MEKNNPKQFPKKIMVLGVPFRIELVADLHDDGEKIDGITFGGLRLIRICTNQDWRRRWTTLSHEYWHAVMHITGLTYVLPDEVEEIIAQTFEHAKESFMRAHGSEYMDALNKGE